MVVSGGGGGTVVVGEGELDALVVGEGGGGAILVDGEGGVAMVEKEEASCIFTLVEEVVLKRRWSKVDEGVRGAVVVEEGESTMVVSGGDAMIGEGGGGTINFT